RPADQKDMKSMTSGWPCASKYQICNPHMIVSETAKAMPIPDAAARTSGPAPEAVRSVGADAICAVVMTPEFTRRGCFLVKEPIPDLVVRILGAGVLESFRSHR